MPADDLQSAAKRAQAEADDASEDHMYVADGLSPTVPACAGMWCDGTAKQNARRLEALVFATVTSIRIWRANGGRGRAVVSLRPAKSGAAVEAHVDVWTSAADAFPSREHEELSQ